MSRSEADTRRELIDPKLKDAGWILQDRNQMNLFAGRCIAVCEFPLDTGYADYMLFVDRKAVSFQMGLQNYGEIIVWILRWKIWF